MFAPAGTRRCAQEAGDIHRTSTIRETRAAKREKPENRMRARERSADRNLWTMTKIRPIKDKGVGKKRKIAKSTGNVRGRGGLKTKLRLTAVIGRVIFFASNRRTAVKSEVRSTLRHRCQNQRPVDSTEVFEKNKASQSKQASPATEHCYEKNHLPPTRGTDPRLSGRPDEISQEKENYPLQTRGLCPKKPTTITKYQFFSRKGRSPEERSWDPTTRAPSEECPTRASPPSAPPWCRSCLERPRRKAARWGPGSSTRTSATPGLTGSTWSPVVEIRENKGGGLSGWRTKRAHFGTTKIVRHTSTMFLVVDKAAYTVMLRGKVLHVHGNRLFSGRTGGWT